MCVCWEPMLAVFSSSFRFPVLACLLACFSIVLSTIRRKRILYLRLWIVSGQNMADFGGGMHSVAWYLIVALYKSVRRPLAGSSSSSPGLHYGPSWWLETEGWSPQTILAQNCGGWPAANEFRTSDSKVTRPGQIGMAATCGNGYVFDKLLKRESYKWWFDMVVDALVF